MQVEEVAGWSTAESIMLLEAVQSSLADGATAAASSQAQARNLTSAVLGGSTFSVLSRSSSTGSSAAQASSSSSSSSSSSTSTADRGVDWRWVASILVDKALRDDAAVFYTEQSCMGRVKDLAVSNDFQNIPVVMQQLRTKRMQELKDVVSKYSQGITALEGEKIMVNEGSLDSTLLEQINDKVYPHSTPQSVCSESCIRVSRQYLEEVFSLAEVYTRKGAKSRGRRSSSTRNESSEQTSDFGMSSSQSGSSSQASSGQIVLDGKRKLSVSVGGTNKSSASPISVTLHNPNSAASNSAGDASTTGGSSVSNNGEGGATSSTSGVASSNVKRAGDDLDTLVSNSNAPVLKKQKMVEDQSGEASVTGGDGSSAATSTADSSVMDVEPSTGDKKSASDSSTIDGAERSKEQKDPESSTANNTKDGSSMELEEDQRDEDGKDGVADSTTNGNSEEQGGDSTEARESDDEFKILSDLLDSFISKEESTPFLEPVDVEEVPAYSAIVTSPMDFGTLRTKMDNGEVTTPLSLFAHISLIYSNAMKFNAKKTEIYKNAHTSSQELLSVFQEKFPDEADSFGPVAVSELETELAPRATRTPKRRASATPKNRSGAAEPSSNKKKKAETPTPRKSRRRTRGGNITDDEEKEKEKEMEKEKEKDDKEKETEKEKKEEPKKRGRPRKSRGGK